MSLRVPDSSYRMPGCVVSHGRLTGFLRMPADPFVWVQFQGSEFDGPVDEGRVDRIVSAPELTVDEGSVGFMVAVSDELVGLFDKYGVSFPVSMSEQLTYEAAGSMGDVVVVERSCRLLFAADVFSVWQCFMQLLNVWVDLYVRVVSPVPVEVGEVRLMRMLLAQFMDAAACSSVAYVSWDDDVNAVLFHLFSPSEERAELDAQEFAERERLMSRFGYHHVW
jgi:hypothetical protein